MDQCYANCEPKRTLERLALLERIWDYGVQNSVQNRVLFVIFVVLFVYFSGRMSGLYLSLSYFLHQTVCALCCISNTYLIVVIPSHREQMSFVIFLRVQDSN